MPAEQLARIKGYTTTINETIDDNTLLEYVINEIYERVLLYLNTDSLDTNLERITARIVSGIFNQTATTSQLSSPDSAILSMSDNGQSVTFANEVKNYLNTTEDNELFAGFSKLLSRYRRINVIS